MCKFSTWPEGIVDSIYSSNISPGFNNVQAHVMNHFNNNNNDNSKAARFHFPNGEMDYMACFASFHNLLYNMIQERQEFPFLFCYFLRIEVFNLSTPHRCYNMSARETNDECSKDLYIFRYWKGLKNEKNL